LPLLFQPNRCIFSPPLPSKRMLRMGSVVPLRSWCCHSPVMRKTPRGPPPLLPSLPPADPQNPLVEDLEEYQLFQPPPLWFCGFFLLLARRTVPTFFFVRMSHNPRYATATSLPNPPFYTPLPFIPRFYPWSGRIPPADKRNPPPFRSPSPFFFGAPLWSPTGSPPKLDAILSLPQATNEFSPIPPPLPQ